MSEEKIEKPELFFPYYVNQGRLLDIYAILNSGYSEYSEITTGLNVEKSRGAKAEISANGGFKLFNLGSTLYNNSEKTDVSSTENKEKKVQTVTSMLYLVKCALSEKGYLHDLLEAEPGDFVCLPVELSINSIKSLLTELSDLVKLVGSIQKMGISISGDKIDLKQIDSIIKTIQVLFDGEEIVYDAGDFAIFGNILDENLYQSVRADLIGTRLMCLAQVKRLFPNGAELMKNTIFTKIKNTDAKEKLIKSFSEIGEKNFFDFEAVAVSAIHDKPVYQLEIIALYQ